MVTQFFRGLGEVCKLNFHLDGFVKFLKCINFPLSFFLGSNFGEIPSRDLKKLDTWESHQALPLEGSREAYNPHEAVYLIVVV